jgi:hypothetical protein
MQKALGLIPSTMQKEKGKMDSKDAAGQKKVRLITSIKFIEILNCLTGKPQLGNALGT